MIISQLSSLTAPRVDHHDGAVWVFGNLPQHRPRPRKTVRLPGVLSDKYGDLAVFEIAMDTRAEHTAIDPHLAGLLLSKRVGTELRPQRPKRAVSVRTSEVVSLSAAPIIEDGFAPVGRFDILKPCGDFGNGSVPVDLLEAAVGTPPQRMPEPVGGILIVIKPLRLFAGIAT